MYKNPGADGVDENFTHIKVMTYNPESEQCFYLELSAGDPFTIIDWLRLGHGYVFRALINRIIAIHIPNSLQLN